MIEKGAKLPVTRQCEILQLSRSSVYYRPVPVCPKELELMRLIDEIHLARPFWGSRNIRDELCARGHRIGRGHVRRLMRKMGIVALYAKPRLSVTHRKYPYLLRGVAINRPNQVWAADITYIPMAKGFCYLVAIMDWASRKVLSWRLSNTLDASFCIEALEEAIMKYGKPGIFNTDQGSQFTSDSFTRILKAHDIKISMDGQGRWRDNIVIERLWKTVKYEEIYLKAYESISHAKKELTKFFDRYNTRRPHQGINDRIPDDVYWETLPKVRDAV